MSKNWMFEYCVVTAIVLLVISILVFSVEEYRQERRVKAWGNGLCETCNVRYELKAATNHIKYYVCNECGKEMSIY